MADVLEPKDADYESARRAAIWQEITPERFPATIVRVTSPDEIVVALERARRDGIRVSVVSSGHSYVGNGIQEGTMLLDLAAFDAIDVDARQRVASVGPAARNGALDAALDEHGLAFPVGHSPTVGVGGYLLAGGLSWNPEHWGGGACFGVTAADVVLASGERVRVAADSHPDLFWALRGAGPFFPGIVTRFDLELRTRPSAVLELTAVYEAEAVEAVVGWVAAILDNKSTAIELSATFTRDGDHARIALSAVAFDETDARAREALRPLLTALPSVGLVGSPTVTDRTIPELLAANDDPPARYCVETVWTSEIAQTLRACARHIAHAPSVESLLWVGLRTAPVPTPDAAFTAPGRAIVFSSAVWQSEAEDATNLDWSDSLVARLKPVSAGSYIAEADYLRHPDRVAACFTAEGLARLVALREAYDPNGVFFAPPMV